MIELNLNPTVSLNRQYAVIDVRQLLNAYSNRNGVYPQNAGSGRVIGVVQSLNIQPSSTTRLQFAASISERDTGPLFSVIPSISGSVNLSFGTVMVSALQNGAPLPASINPALCGLTDDGVWTISDSGSRLGVVGVYAMADRTYKSRLPRDGAGVPITAQAYASNSAVQAEINNFPRTVEISGVAGTFIGALVIRNTAAVFTAGSTTIPALRADGIFTADGQSIWANEPALFSPVVGTNLNGVATVAHGTHPISESAQGQNGVWRFDLTGVRRLWVRVASDGLAAASATTYNPDIRIRFSLTTEGATL